MAGAASTISCRGSGLALSGIGRAVLAPDAHHLVVETQFYQQGLFILRLVHDFFSPSDRSRNNLKITEVSRLRDKIFDFFSSYDSG